MRLALLALPALSALATLSLLSGCATTDNNSNAAVQREEKVAVTGSNIPRRDPAGYGVEAVSREALEARQRTSGGATTKGSEVPRW